MFFERVTPLHIPRGPFQFESFLDDLWDQDDCQCSFGQRRNNRDRNICTDRWLNDMSAYIPVAHALAMACQSASEEDDDIAKDDDDSSNSELSSDESHEEESPQLDHTNDNLTQSDQSGCKIVQLELDLSDFEPEDIKIKTKDGKYLEVKAKHEDKSNSHHSYGEVHRVFTIPENVDPESLKSMLSPEGILRIEAPIRAAVEGQKSPKTLL